MLTRRELLTAGGLALAGRLLPSSLLAWSGAVSEVEIAMRSADGGARVWFDPVGLLVRPGSTVRWVLVDGVHTATACHSANGDYPDRIPRRARPWDSGYLTEAGESFAVTLELEGVYDFLCRPHAAAGMVGRIVVASEQRAAAWLETDRAALPGSSYPGDGLSPAALTTLPPTGEVLRRGRIPGGP